MNDVGTNGVMAYLIASNTMPIGFPILKFADDVDSIAVQEAETGAAVLDLNGKVIGWTVASTISVSIGVIAGSTEDDLLNVLYNASRVSQLTKIANDSINLVVRWPNGGIRTFMEGRMQSGPASPTGTAEGRMVGNVYTFVFGDQASLTLASVINTIGNRFDLSGLAEGALSGIGFGGAAS